MRLMNSLWIGQASIDSVCTALKKSGQRIVVPSGGHRFLHYAADCSRPCVLSQDMTSIQGISVIQYQIQSSSSVRQNRNKLCIFVPTSLRCSRMSLSGVPIKLGTCKHTPKSLITRCGWPVQASQRKACRFQPSPKQAFGIPTMCHFELNMSMHPFRPSLALVQTGMRVDVCYS